jgi:hypothetical protein
MAHNAEGTTSYGYCVRAEGAKDPGGCYRSATAVVSLAWRVRDCNRWLIADGREGPDGASENEHL